jgi:hypothetical protein
MERKEKISRGKWYVINIKAHKRQNAEHYVQLFENIKNEDPIIPIYASKCASIQQINFGPRNEKNIPHWIEIILMTYTIVDADSFYNKRKKEDVMLESWNPDWVANKNEVQLIFVPDIHVLALKKSSKVSLNSVVKYLSLAAEHFEADMFDITPIKDRGIISRIQNAHSITKIEAKISFSNPAHTDDFLGLFDNKLKEMNPGSFEIKAENKNDLPLNHQEDGLIDAMINLSECNGVVKARIKETEDSKYVVINTNDYPAEYEIICYQRELWSYIRNFLINIYGEK